MYVDSPFRVHGWETVQRLLCLSCQDRGLNFDSSFYMNLMFRSADVKMRCQSQRDGLFYTHCVSQFLPLPLFMLARGHYLWANKHKGCQLSSSSLTTATKVGQIWLNDSLHVSYFRCLISAYDSCLSLKMQLFCVCHDFWDCSLLMHFGFAYLKISSSFFLTNATAFWTKVSPLFS